MSKWEIGSWTADYTLDLNGEVIAVIKGEHIDEGHAIAGKLSIFDHISTVLNRELNTPDKMLSAFKNVRDLMVRGGFLKKGTLHTLDGMELAMLSPAEPIESVIAPAPQGKIVTTIEFKKYNSRRYGNPWIAVVTAWPVGISPELTFGRYLGTDAGGVAEVAANVGTVIRYGQRDGRNPRHTESNFAIALADGCVLDVDEVTAAKHYRSEDRDASLADLLQKRDRRVALAAEHAVWMETQRAIDPSGRWTSTDEYKRRTAALQAALDTL